jgi:hypothetical protein
VSDRDAHWWQDIQYFADRFSRRQADFAKPYPSFREEIAQIEKGIPSLTAHRH